MFSLSFRLSINPALDLLSDKDTEAGRHPRSHSWCWLEPGVERTRQPELYCPITPGKSSMPLFIHYFIRHSDARVPTTSQQARG